MFGTQLPFIPLKINGSSIESSVWGGDRMSAPALQMSKITRTADKEPHTHNLKKGSHEKRFTRPHAMRCRLFVICCRPMINSF